MFKTSSFCTIQYTETELIIEGDFNSSSNLGFYLMCHWIAHNLALLNFPDCPLCSVHINNKYEFVLMNYILLLNVNLMNHFIFSPVKKVHHF